MIDFFRNLFSTDFMPHVYCLRQTDVIWLHVASDVLTAASYFMIPVALSMIMWRYRTLAHRWIFGMFGAFIVACGFTHVLGVVTLWYPIYRLEGAVKAATALISCVTAIALVRLVPRVILVPNIEQRLAIEIQGHKRSNKRNISLEKTLLGRTHELEASQQELLRVNKTLVKSQESLRDMIEATPSAMAMADSNGTMQMVNAELEASFGYPRAELLGMSIDKLLPERFHAHHPDPPGGSSAVSVLDATDSVQFFGRRKDGSEFPFDISLNPIKTEEGTKVMSAIVDVTDRKLKESRVEAALREKEILLGEIHHRVKNNLQIIHSLLDLQSMQVTDPAVTSMLRDAQGRIRSMALIHQTLYQSKDFAVVDFGMFLDSLVPTLIQSYLNKPERVGLTINAKHVSLPIDAAIPCGLLVNELIANCLKHAFPGERRGKIGVDFVREPDGMLVLSVSDDGIGIPEGFDLSESQSLGLQLVYLLTDQLKGTMTVHHADPTRFVLRFSIENPALASSLP